MDPIDEGREKDRRRLSGSIENRVDQLLDRTAEQERRIDRLVLACQALFEILRERDGLTSAEIQARINEIDLRDGVLDGKMKPQVVKCTGCGRPVSSSRPKCIFCETTNPVDYFVG